MCALERLITQSLAASAVAGQTGISNQHIYYQPRAHSETLNIVLFFLLFPDRKDSPELKQQLKLLLEFEPLPPHPPRTPFEP